jgi:hypothetical protein
MASVTVDRVNPSGSYPTATTCQDFIGNTAVFQENGQYSVKGNKISQANPGVIFYYSRFVATSTIAFVNQAIEHPPTANGFASTMPVQSAAVFTPTCAQTNVGVATAPVAERTFTTAWGSETDGNALKLTGLVVGTEYVLQVKYSVSGLAGATAPAGGTPILYQFETWNGGKTALVAKDENGFLIVKK